MFLEGSMPSSIAKGMIFLIPKGEGPSEHISKWRPITILNTIYKMIAKDLNLRLLPVLNRIIHASQTGFLLDMGIFDNIFTFWEAAALAIKQKQKRVILFLDFEKRMIEWIGTFSKVSCQGLVFIHNGVILSCTDDRILSCTDVEIQW